MYKEGNLRYGQSHGRRRYTTVGCIGPTMDAHVALTKRAVNYDGKNVGGRSRVRPQLPREKAEVYKS